MATDTKELAAGRELNALIHTLVMGEEPERIAIVTSNGGKSACAGVSRDGPWYTREQLESWLAEKQSQGLLTEYALGEWKRYPPYSENIATAWEVITTMSANGWCYKIECRDRQAFVKFYNGQTVGAGFFEDGPESDLPLLISRAALLAVRATS